MAIFHCAAIFHIYCQSVVPHRWPLEWYFLQVRCRSWHQPSMSNR